MRLSAVVLLFSLFSLPEQAFSQNDLVQKSAVALLRQVADNELADRAQQLKWAYCVEKSEGGYTLTQKQIETKEGPLHRILLINHKSVRAEELAQDRNRLDLVVNDPRQRVRLKNDYDEDESKLKRLIGILPDAFLYESSEKNGNLLTLKFLPNPHYVPATYEMRIAHQLTGTLVIDASQKRLVRLSGTLARPVEFGFGLLGRVEKGGGIQIARTQVAPSHWKTSLIDVQMGGRILILKSVSKQQHEVRYQFENVPADLSLSQARQLLFSAASNVGCTKP